MSEPQELPPDEKINEVFTLFDAQREGTFTFEIHLILGTIGLHDIAIVMRCLDFCPSESDLDTLIEKYQKKK